MKKSVFCLIAVSLLLSCNNGNEKKETPAENGKTVAKLSEMKVEKSDGSWDGDVMLHIQRTEKLSPEVTSYRIVSGFNNKPAGFDLIVKRPAKRTLFVSDGVTFRSLGDTSNNFLIALAAVYGLRVNAPFIDSLTITYADLGAEMDLNKPGNQIAAQMKLFFETDDDAPELYLNIDEEAGTISFPEKDKGYRSGVLQALAEKRKL